MTIELHWNVPVPDIKKYERWKKVYRVRYGPQNHISSCDEVLSFAKLMMVSYNES